MGTNKSRVADRVKQERTKRGWSQSGLAERAGLDRKTVNRLENGANFPTWDSLDAISQALGMTVQKLYSNDTE